MDKPAGPKSVSGRVRIGALLLVLLGLAAAAVLAFIAPRTSADLITLPELEAKYATPASRFVEVEGVRVHYVDEGTGSRTRPARSTPSPGR